MLDRCTNVDAGSREALDRLFASGARVVAVATRDGAQLSSIGPADERGLQLSGFLTFADPPKADSAAALGRLRALGIEVKVVTGDNALVAHKVPAKYLELASGGHGLNGYKGPMWDAWQEQSLAWRAELKLTGQ